MLIWVQFLLQNFDVSTESSESLLTSLSTSLPTTPSLTSTSLETVLTTSSTTSAWPLQTDFQDPGPSSTLVSEIFSHVGDVISSATTPEVVEDLDGPVDLQQGVLLISEDGGRRQLLIGLICLAVILLLVLLAIGYFFYRVWYFLICLVDLFSLDFLEIGTDVVKLFNSLTNMVDYLSQIYY